VTPRLAVVPEVESELDELFARPLDEFTTARNELARRLRKAGQDEAAALVQGLKKPSVPVWAVNQLARRHPETVRELVAAGERLRKAQEQAFRGGGTDAVREATAAERSAARTLTRLAHELLEAEDRPVTRAVTDRLGSLLRTAAVDPEAARLLEEGRVTEEVEASGFEAFAGMAVPKRPKRPARKAAAQPTAAERRREERLQQLRTRRDELEQRAREAEHAAEEAERAAGKARQAAGRARAAADRAAAEVAEAAPTRR
jgi:hypothetical protein